MHSTSVATAHGVLSVATAGDGSAHRLLLVHGFTGAKEDFTEWLDPLASIGWEAAAVDLRGHGVSMKPDGLDSYGFEILADDLVDVADGLGWDRFALLGHSMGGMVAQLVALSPAGLRLSGLVLMDTAHGPVERIERQVVELACAIVANAGMPALIETRDALQREGRLPLTTAAQQRVLLERPGHEEFNTRKMLATAPDAYRSLAMTMFDQADRLEALSRLDLPVLVMVGEEDLPFVEASRRMAGGRAGGGVRGDPRSRPQPAVREPRGLVGGAGPDS